MINKPEEILKETVTDNSILNLRKDGIITLELKEGVTGQTLESMKKDLTIFKEWAKDGKLAFLVDARQFKKFDMELRLYAQEQSSLFASKYGIIISSGVSSFLANIFIYLNRPKVPTKLFTKKETAIKWMLN